MGVPVVEACPCSTVGLVGEPLLIENAAFLSVGVPSTCPLNFVDEGERGKYGLASTTIFLVSGCPEY